MLAKRYRIKTTYPMSPQKMVEKLVGIAKHFGNFDRISAGFPGLTRKGKILTAPHFVTESGPGSPIDPKLSESWKNFDLQTALENRLKKPCLVANDADVAGLGVIKGKGLEIALTLGTGFGSGTFYDGKLCPHLELAHHPLRGNKTYNELLGEAARREVGNKKWLKRVAFAIECVRTLTGFDHLYIGGGNSGRVSQFQANDITIVSNSAGLIGGVKLWDSTN